MNQKENLRTRGHAVKMGGTTLFVGGVGMVCEGFNRAKNIARNPAHIQAFYAKSDGLRAFQEGGMNILDEDCFAVGRKALQSIGRKGGLAIAAGTDGAGIFDTYLARASKANNVDIGVVIMEPNEAKSNMALDTITQYGLGEKVKVVSSPIENLETALEKDETLKAMTDKYGQPKMIYSVFQLHQMNDLDATNHIREVVQAAAPEAARMVVDLVRPRTEWLMPFMGKSFGSTVSPAFAECFEKSLRGSFDTHSVRQMIDAHAKSLDMQVVTQPGLPGTPLQIHTVTPAANSNDTGAYLKMPEDSSRRTKIVGRLMGISMALRPAS